MKDSSHETGDIFDSIFDFAGNHAAGSAVNFYHLPHRINASPNPGSRSMWIALLPILFFRY
jgi:hypothetical protein